MLLRPHPLAYPLLYKNNNHMELNRVSQTPQNKNKQNLSEK